LLLCIKVDTVVETCRVALLNNQSPVISLWSTGESRQKEALEEEKEKRYLAARARQVAEKEAEREEKDKKVLELLEQGRTEVEAMREVKQVEEAEAEAARRQVAGVSAEEVEGLAEEELEKKLPTSVSVKPDELYRFSTAYLSLTNLIKVHLPVSAVVTKIMTPGVEHTH